MAMSDLEMEVFKGMQSVAGLEGLDGRMFRYFRSAPFRRRFVRLQNATANVSPSARLGFFRRWGQMLGRRLRAASAALAKQKLAARAGSTGTAYVRCTPQQAVAIRSLISAFSKRTNVAKAPSWRSYYR